MEVLFVGGETAKGELESTDEIDVAVGILVAFKSSDGAVFIESSFSELVVSSLSESLFDDGIDHLDVEWFY